MEAKDRGALLEDTVASIFRGWGFEVQPRITLTDEGGATHEIDVLASKQEAFGLVNVAIECKNVVTPIGIEHLRNFQTKLRRLNISKGIFVSTGGFSAGAIDFARSVGIELWDDAELWKKAGKARPTGLLNDALRVFAADPKTFARPSSLVNAGKFFRLNENKTKVQYVPMHILEYDCYSQRSVKGSVVDLTSRGDIALDDQSSNVWDFRVASGFSPQFKSHIPVLNLLQTGRVEPEVVELGANVEVGETKLSPRTARQQAVRVLAENLQRIVELQTGKAFVTEKRVLKPRQKDIKILSQKKIYYPIWMVSLDYMNREFVRRVDGVTGEVIREISLPCVICGKAAMALCNMCGVAVCRSHLKKCENCGNVVCARSSCSTSKGTFFKKWYCSSCVPIA